MIGPFEIVATVTEQARNTIKPLKVTILLTNNALFSDGVCKLTYTGNKKQICLLRTR